MARVTGIGGIFLRARDPKALAAWYAKHLHFPLTPYGTVKFVWAEDPGAKLAPGVTTWATFPADTTYFGPGTPAGRQEAMVTTGWMTSTVCWRS